MPVFSCFSCGNDDPRIWGDILKFELDGKFILVTLMIVKNECDLIWKIMHGTIAAGRFLYVNNINN